LMLVHAGKQEYVLGHFRTSITEVKILEQILSYWDLEVNV